MPHYQRRKQEENPWAGLSQAQYKVKLAECERESAEAGIKVFYEMASAEGFEGNFEDYKRQWEWPFREDGHANPRFEKSWDGSEAVRKSAEAVKAAVTLGTDHELKL